MKAVLKQFFKFGMVGFLCFLVDFVIYTILFGRLGVNYLIAGFFGSSVSVIVNYILSTRFVFRRRDDISRKAEFGVYVILSVIGLGLNEFILFLCVDIIYARWIWSGGVIEAGDAKLLAKILATGIVMIYNFVTRKMFLEKGK